ncbi:MAG: PIN domain-containing protein [Candidatus Aenigmatarchaeota archaeon]
MKLVVDTNVLFSFFKKDSITRKIITLVDLFEFYTLKSRLGELIKHKEEVCTKANITPEDFLKTLDEIKIFINVIDDEKVKQYIKEAKKLAPHEEDIPCFALALALNSSIWSNEEEFKNQDKIKVLSTSDLIDLLSRLEIEKFI